MGAIAVLPARVRESLSCVRLTPFDQSTQEGRASERHRRVALTAAASALAKVLSVGTALISVPLTLHYLGVERFGMWMMISSLITMLAFADFGIANGVLSLVADAHGRDDRAALQRIVSSGFFMLSAIAAGLLALFAAAYAYVPWHAVFNVQGDLARAEAGPALAVFMACFACAIPLGVVQRVQMGLQQGFLASLWHCLGSLCALAGVLLVIRLQGGLAWLVLALAGAPLLAALLNSLHFYLRRQPGLRPRLACFTVPDALRLMRMGALFFVLQVTVAVAYTSDSLVIAQLSGAAAVAEYAVPEKLFGLITLVIAMVLAPLWPAYGEAIARGDHTWVRRTLRRSFLLAVGLAALASVCLLLAGPMLLRLWVGDALAVPFMLMLALAIWKVIEAGGNAVAVYLNGAHVVGYQVASAVSVAVCAISLKFLLIPTYGVAGAVWATVAAYLVFAAVPYAILLPRLVASGTR
jgi:O-antigen/teichoic acid export membrane protein